MPSEKEVMSGIKSCLEKWEYRKTVEYWERLNSGKIQVGYRWVQLAKKGSPDFICILRNKAKNLSLLFIEAKSDVGQLRLEQKQFRDKFTGLKDIGYFVIRDSQELDTIIRDIGWDKSQEEIDAIQWPGNKEEIH